MSKQTKANDCVDQISAIQWDDRGYCHIGRFGGHDFFKVYDNSEFSENYQVSVEGIIPIGRRERNHLTHDAFSFRRDVHSVELAKRLCKNSIDNMLNKQMEES